MQISQENHGQVLLIGVAGRLDSTTAGDLELVLHDAGVAGHRHYVIDLAQTAYVSSAGLRVLLALAKKLDGGLGSIRLCGLNASVRKVFDISGFTGLFALYGDRQAALDRHPHRLDASADLVGAAAALLGATQPHDQSVSGTLPSNAVAELLGAPKLDPEADLQHRATMVGKGVSEPVAVTENKPGLLGRLFGKN
jgi:anti-anti-sigma factor